MTVLVCWKWYSCFVGYSATLFCVCTECGVRSAEKYEERRRRRQLLDILKQVIEGMIRDRIEGRTMKKADSYRIAFRKREDNGYRKRKH